MHRPSIKKSLLKAKLRRPRRIIYNLINDLNAPKARKGQKFTADEYTVILKHVLGPKIPNDANEILMLCDRKKSWKILESILQRNRRIIQSTWSETIHPTILAHLSGTLNLDGKKNVFQFMVDKKYISLKDIDWNAVTETLPTCTKSELSNKVIQFVDINGKEGVPLYQTIAENLHWRKNFFKFIIENRYISVTDIDWNVVKEKWPSISKRNLSVTTDHFVRKHGKKGLPLHQNISENLHHMRDCKKASQIKLDLIDEFEKLRNKD